LQFFGERAVFVQKIQIFAGDTTEHAGLLRKVVLPIMKLVFFAVIGRSKLG